MHTLLKLKLGAVTHKKLMAAYDLFLVMRQQQKVDNVTYISLIKGCANEQQLELGKKLHSMAVADCITFTVALVNNLLHFYMKCAQLDTADNLFQNLVKKCDDDIISWNIMMDGYVKNKLPQHAISLFKELQQNHTHKPDCVTYTALLSAHLDMDQANIVLSYFETLQKGEVKISDSLWIVVLKAAEKVSSLATITQIYLQLQKSNAILSSAVYHVTHL